MYSYVIIKFIEYAIVYVSCFPCELNKFVGD